jgi:hypothetical protein
VAAWSASYRPERSWWGWQAATNSSSSGHLPAFLLCRRRNRSAGTGLRRAATSWLKAGWGRRERCYFLWAPIWLNNQLIGMFFLLREATENNFCDTPKKTITCSSAAYRSLVTYHCNL